MRGIAAVVLGLTLLACDTSHELDGGAPTDAPPIVLPDAALPMPLAPADPAPIDWTCPSGWTEVAVGDSHGCEPWPADFAGCPDGEIRFVGDPACTSLAAACPSGEFAEGLPATGVRYVSAGAAAGGDGSLAAPFATIAEAVAGAVAGDTIAIGKGTYDETIHLTDRALSLRGACAAETTIRTATAPASAAVLRSSVDGARFEGLTIGGDRVGVRADGASLTLRDLVLDRPSGFGIIATATGTIDAERILIRDVVTTSGSAIAVTAGGQLTLRRATIEDTPNVGIFVFDPGSRLEATDVAIRRTIADETDALIGTALGLGIEGTVRFERVVVEDAFGIGLAILGGSTLDGSDLLVRRIVGRPSDGAAGGAISCQSSSVLRLSRAWLDDNVAAGITVLGSAEPPRVEASDLLISATRSSDMTGEGAALYMSRTSSTSLTRMHVENAQSVGLGAENYAEVTLADVVFHDIRPSTTGIGGRAINLTNGGVIVGDRVLVHDAAESAILAHGDDTSVTLRDLRIHSIRSRPSDGATGRALTALGGAHLTVERAHLSEAREVSVLVFGPGSLGTLSDVTVERTLPSECATTTCMDAAGGTGIAAVDEASLVLSSFLSRDNALAGLQLARGVSVDASGGVISGNAVGVNVQEVDFDLSELTRDIFYSDNGVNLDTSDLAIPSASL